MIDFCVDGNQIGQNIVETLHFSEVSLSGQQGFDRLALFIQNPEGLLAVAMHRIEGILKPYAFEQFF